jgi:hypothetical protein
MEIDKKTYKAKRDNYYITKHKKTQIILAGSLRKDNFHIKRLQRKDFGKTKKWPTFTITREGKIYQHFDPKYYSDFMNDKEVDKHSISIVLENMGMVFFDYEANTFLNALHEKCDEKFVHEKNWRGYSYCEKYTEPQYDATLNLCVSLCKEYKIPIDSLGMNVFHEDTPRFKGIVTRSNFDVEHTDLNPSFNFARFCLDLNSYEEQETQIND